MVSPDQSTSSRRQPSPAGGFVPSKNKHGDLLVEASEIVVRNEGVRLASGLGCFILVIGGRGRLRHKNKDYTVGPDTYIHFSGPEAAEAVGGAGDPLRLCLVGHNESSLCTELQNKLASISPFFMELGGVNVNQARALRSIFQEILFEQNALQEGWALLVQSRVVELAVRAIRLAQRRFAAGMPVPNASSESSERVAKYALRLKSEFCQQQSLAEAARTTGLSPRQFTRLFRQVTGQNWCKYVLDLRLNHAAELLAMSDRTVLDVAFEAGFDDLSHFHRCFKVRYGSSPMAYREQRQVRLSPKVAGQVETSGFKFRGVKGWSWTTEQYLREIPIIAEFKLNMLIDCDGAIAELGRMTLREEWWKPMDEARKASYLSIIAACREHHLTFCFAPHPHLGAFSPMDPGKPELRRVFEGHYSWMQSQGVQWFGVCFDGTSWGSAGPEASGLAHAELVNSLYAGLLAKDQNARFIFRPVSCSGDGSNPEQRAYLEALARELHHEVFVFWDGDGSVTPRTTRVAAESFKRIVKHRLFLWDNYPANDGSPTMHLGPISGRDPDLCEIIDGYISNPMHPQSEINRLPLATCADYAANPGRYNPSRSIGQAICRFAQSSSQQQILKSLVQAYPGFIVAGGGTGTNPVRKRFEEVAACQGLGAAHRFAAEIKEIYKQLVREFPKQFLDARRTLEQDLAWMSAQGG